MELNGVYTNCEAKLHSITCKNECWHIVGNCAHTGLTKHVYSDALEVLK